MWPSIWVRKWHVENPFERCYNVCTLLRLEPTLDERSILTCAGKLELEVVLGPRKGALTADFAIFKISLIVESVRFEFTSARYFLVLERTCDLIALWINQTSFHELVACEIALHHSTVQVKLHAFALSDWLVGFQNIATVTSYLAIGFDALICATLQTGWKILASWIGFVVWSLHRSILRRARRSFRC